jgi:hypothetical protein
MNDTPETDAKFGPLIRPQLGDPMRGVKEFCGNMERQRDEARRLAEQYRDDRFRYGMHESRRKEHLFPWEEKP